MIAKALFEKFPRLRSLWRTVRSIRALSLAIILLALAISFGNHTLLFLMGMAFPFGLVLTSKRPRLSLFRNRDGSGDMPRRQDAVDALDQFLEATRDDGWQTAAFVVEVDNFKRLEERHDHATASRLVAEIGKRISSVLRDGDVTARLDGPSFALALAPSRLLDLESAIQLAGRVQRIASEAIPAGETAVHLSVSIGLSLPDRLTAPDGEMLLQAATSALIEAQRSGPSAIRSYSDAMRDRIALRHSLSKQVSEALSDKQIRAYFQPQLSARTGAITGFETLARWHHPERGLIPPSEFLPALEQAGLMGRLGERMIIEALEAIRHWDANGFDIPRIGVNFSSDELCDPRLVDRICWELDRYDLAADRLVVEVLETVVASKIDDVVIRNLAGLARLGCCLDLDDFGTGNASITSIRRFAIERIKIDRSFVTHIDEDPEQQKMVAAILTMADRLGLDTLAEGVETPEEQRMLLQLGCGHVQGFGIARPMPLAEADAWIRNYRGTTQGSSLKQLKAI